jgi:hypothetical protein
MRILAEGPDGRILPLVAEDFDVEAQLQSLLEEHPDLVLAGSDDESGTRVWTIGYEVPTDAGSIDLLMLDSTARLWVVETKLVRNPEIKKQVVGQVLGYASCAAEWSATDLELIGDNYLGRRRDESTSLVEYLAQELGSEEAAAQLLEDAAEHAQLGDLTALVVADGIPRQLRRLVEFVNSSASFELLVLKIGVVLHNGERLFIPTVVGSVSSSPAAKSREARSWDLDSFLQALGEQSGPDVVEVAKSILEWSEGMGLRLAFGKGRVSGSCYPMLDHNVEPHWTFALWTYGSAQAHFGRMVDHGPFQDESRRLELANRLNQVPGVEISEESASKYPHIGLQDLGESAALGLFLDAWSWYVDEVRAS